MGGGQGCRYLYIQDFGVDFCDDYLFFFIVYGAFVVSGLVLLRTQVDVERGFGKSGQERMFVFLYLWKCRWILLRWRGESNKSVFILEMSRIKLNFFLFFFKFVIFLIFYLIEFSLFEQQVQWLFGIFRVGYSVLSVFLVFNNRVILGKLFFVFLFYL